MSDKTTNATVEAWHRTEATAMWKGPGIEAVAQALANLEAARAENERLTGILADMNNSDIIAKTMAENADLTNRLAEIDPTPWADFHGDLPDYDHPLRPVYESGIQYAVNLLAKVLEVTDYEPCDGTEEFDGDLGGTMGNIVLAAMPKDEHGDPIWPKDLHTPSPCPGCAAKDEAMAEMKATITEAMDLGVTEEAWDVLKPYRIPPADPLAEALKAAVYAYGGELIEGENFDRALAELKSRLGGAK